MGVSRRNFFPPMRSEGFPFYTLGVWGLRCVRSTPFLCSQPFAGDRLCGAYGKSCKRRDFGIIQVLRSFISRGRRGTL